MATVRRRPGQDKWYCYWTGADGRRKSCAGTTDKKVSEGIARRRETDARLVREGIKDPGEDRRRVEGLRSIADHAEDYRLHLLAKGGTRGHARHVKGAVVRLLAESGARSVATISPVQVQAALARRRAKDDPPSARTLNHAAGAVRAFLNWLADDKRIKEVPAGLKGLGGFNEAADRRKVRRALSAEEVDRLIAAAESGPTITRKAPRGRAAGKPARGGDGSKGRPRSRPISGPQRAALYRLALGTGFRAEELRTLTPERFRLDGDAPTVTVLACYAKNGKEECQPITPALAEHVRPFVEAAGPGKAVLPVPRRTAEMLAGDLEAAGIPVETADGVLDFHALRATFITRVVDGGATVSVAQRLARHSTPTLTIGRYAKVDEKKLRDALEGKGGG